MERKEKNVNNLAFQYYLKEYQNPSDMHKKLCETKGKKNEDKTYI